MKQVYKKKRVVQPSHIDEKLRKINRTRLKGSRFAEKTYLEQKNEFEEAFQKAKQIAETINTEITENVHDQILSYTKLINLNKVTVNGYEKKMIQLFRDYLPGMRTLNVLATKPKEIVHILDNDQFSIKSKKGFIVQLLHI